MMDQSEANLEEGLISRSQRQIEGKNQIIQRDSKSIVSKSHSKKEVMNQHKDTVFMSTQSLISQREDAAVAAVNPSTDEMGNSNNAHETQDWQGYKQTKRKKTTPKHK